MWASSQKYYDTLQAFLKRLLDTPAFQSEQKKLYDEFPLFVKRSMPFPGVKGIGINDDEPGAQAYRDRLQALGNTLHLRGDPAWHWVRNLHKCVRDYKELTVGPEFIEHTPRYTFQMPITVDGGQSWAEFLENWTELGRDIWEQTANWKKQRESVSCERDAQILFERIVHGHDPLTIWRHWYDNHNEREYLSLENIRRIISETATLLRLQLV